MVKATKNATTQSDLRVWLVGRKIVRVDYAEENVLALMFDDNTVLLCYTELISQGVKKQA